MYLTAFCAIRHTITALLLAQFICAGLLCCITSPVAAQAKRADVPSSDSVKARELKEVKVFAAIHSLADTSSVPVQQMKEKDIERVNSLSVADAVRYFSGVQIKDYGGVGGLKTINVRSLGSNHTAVFYDGIELGNAQNGQVDLGRFSLDNIEEITLYEGQKNAIFQPASAFAAASALYLTSKKPVFAPGTSSTERFSLKTGSFGLFDPSFRWQHKVSDEISSTVSAEWMSANGRYPFRYTNGVYDTTAIRNNGDIKSQRLEASLIGKFRDSSGWTAKIYCYNSARGLPGAIVANNFNYNQRLWDQNFFLQSSYHKDLKDYSFMTNAKYVVSYERYLDPDYVTTTGFLDNRYHEYEAYFSVAQLYRLKSWWNISLSDDWRYNKLDANLYHFVYPTRNTWLNNVATEVHFSGFNLQANLLSTLVNDQVREYTGAGKKSELTPAVLVSWKPFRDQDLGLRGFYKNIFRMPTFNDLYYTFVGSTFLKPEFAVQYDMGFTYNRTIPGQRPAVLSIQADAYYNRITDKIIAIPGADLFRWTMINLGIVGVKGFEATARATWQLGGSLVLHTGITYTYEQSRDLDPGDNYKQQIPYTPLNSGSALISADWRGFALNYSFIYTGYRYDQSANIPVNYQQPWYTHDLALAYKITRRNRTFKISLEVNNLFNQYYDVVNNFPMPGRSYRITLQISI